MFKGFCVFFFFAIPCCFALENTLPKGRIQFRTVFRILAADEYLNHDEVAIIPNLGLSPADYEDNNGSLELTYGWTHGVAMIFKTGYRRTSLDSASESVTNSGFPTVYLGIRQNLSRLGHASRLMTETGVHIPIEADRDEALPLDSDGISWDFIMSYNQDFLPTTGGYEMDFGYRLRNGDHDDEYFFDTKLKLDFQRLVKATLHYHVVESRHERRIEYDLLAYPNERGFQTLGLDFERAITPRWLLALGYEDVIKARNQFKSSGWRLTVTWRNF